MPSKSSLLRPYYPALDGLRAAAFLAVFACHYCPPGPLDQILRWGWMGVDIFFVLSGFLITGILFDSLEQPHFFRDFYGKRALRIFPLFYGFWLVLLLLTPVLHLAWNAYNLANLAYISNFLVPGYLLGHHADPIRVFAQKTLGGFHLQLSLDHFWSLCVEEQFYLFWPAVIWFVRDRRKLLRLCLTVVAVLPFCRAAYFHIFPLQATSNGIFMNSFFRMDTLLLGGAVALWLRNTAVPTASIRRMAIVLLAAAPLLFAAGYSLQTSHAIDPRNDLFVASIGYTLVAIGSAAVLLLAIDARTLVYKILHQPLLLALGAISYGLYFFHFLPWAMLTAAAPNLREHHIQWLVAFLVLASTVLAAQISYACLELPFLRLKSRLFGRRTVPADAPQSATSQHQALSEADSLSHLQ